MAKKTAFSLFFLIILNVTFAQNSRNFISVDSNGVIAEIDPLTCTTTIINSCSEIKALSIALFNGEIYLIESNNFFGPKNKLYKTKYNSLSSCIYLGEFDGEVINGLTSSPDGLIYAACKNQIEKFDPKTNTFSIVGTLNKEWESSGDLIFYNDQLLMSTLSNELINIDLNNIENSKTVIKFPDGSKIYGLCTVNTKCGENALFAVNSLNNSTNLMPINFNSNTIGSTICRLDFQIFDTTSITESTKNNLITPVFDIQTSMCEGSIKELPKISTNGILGNWTPKFDNTKTTKYTFTPNIDQCAKTNELIIKINKQPKPTPTDGYLCYNLELNSYSNYTIDSNLNNIDYRFEWFKNKEKLNDTISKLIVNKPDVYTLIAKDIITGCISIPMTVTISLKRTDSIKIKYSISNSFENNQQINVNVNNGIGEFYYQLDNNNLQLNSIFENIQAGKHTISVYSINDCLYNSINVTLLKYPHFFTPNGDTINDFWNVDGLQEKSYSKIYIYDRYGKLLNENDGKSLGWDGTFNGYHLPSDDYWFKVIYYEDNYINEFRSHFTLKR